MGVFWNIGLMIMVHLHRHKNISLTFGHTLILSNQLIFMHRQYIYILLGTFIYFVMSSCGSSTIEGSSVDKNTRDSVQSIEKKSEINKDISSYDTVAWVDVAKLIPSARLDIRYATDNNFMGQVIYDCPACLLRREAAEALVQVAEVMAEEGLGLVLFDCYRPAPYQQRLWDVMPDKRYVAPPEKGSNHSRGLAVDLSLFDFESGEELDMGTEYDYFGPEAHPGYANHPALVDKNREKLSYIMEDFGFAPITSEWWHFDFKGKRYEVSEFLWDCPFD